MSAFGVFYGILQAAAYGSVAGATPAARQAFGRQMEALGRQLTLVLPLPHGIDSIAGFIQWRVYGALPALFGFWALMSAAGAARGDEERGLVERCLAEGVSRTRYVAVRCLGFVLACAIAVTLTSAAIDVGAAGSGSALPVGPLLQVSLALLAVTLVIYGLTLALSQMVSSRTAAMGAAGLVVGGLYFVNGLSRSLAGLEPRLLRPGPLPRLDQPPDGGPLQAAERLFGLPGCGRPGRPLHGADRLPLVWHLPGAARRLRHHSGGALVGRRQRGPPGDCPQRSHLTDPGGPGAGPGPGPAHRDPDRRHLPGTRPGNTDGADPTRPGEPGARLAGAGPLRRQLRGHRRGPGGTCPAGHGRGPVGLRLRQLPPHRAGAAPALARVGAPAIDLFPLRRAAQRRRRLDRALDHVGGHGPGLCRGSRPDAAARRRFLG